MQEDFRQGGGTLLQKLENYIDGCDRVIALVGSAYGWAPKDAEIPESAPPRSYTQWEYRFAQGGRLDGCREDVETDLCLLRHARLSRPASGGTAGRRRTTTAAVHRRHRRKRQGPQLYSIRSTSWRGWVLRDGFRLADAHKYQLHNLPYDSLGTLFKGRDPVIEQIRTDLTFRCRQRDRHRGQAGHPRTGRCRQDLSGRGIRLALPGRLRRLPVRDLGFAGKSRPQPRRPVRRAAP